jgi:segregation and condensation protein B
LTEINENEINDGVNTDAGDDVSEGINTDINTDVGDDINEDVDTDINTDADNDNGINGGVNTDVSDDIDKGIDTDVNTGVGNETNDGINTDTADVVDGDTQIQSAQEDDGAIDETRILEALLFASDEHLTAAKLKSIIPGSPDARHIRKMAGEINERLLTEGHPFEIVEAGGGYQFRTLAVYHPYVRKLYKERAAKKLSLQALECLAIIAYRQPISKAEVEAIRGVLSDGAMKTLLERKLIDLCGRSDKPGRPWLYGTTGDFLRYFGINKIGDLPRMEEFEQMARAKMEEMSADELSTEKEVGVEEGEVINDGHGEERSGETADIQ